MNIRAYSLLAVVCLLAGQAVADDKPVQAEASSVGACAGQNLTTFTIRSARVDDPFWVLRWRKLNQATLDAVKGLEGKPYSFMTVNLVSKMIESKAWLPDTPDTRVQVSFSDIGVENCQEGKLDVVFFVFSAAVSSELSSVIEWRNDQKDKPGDAAGVAKANAPMQFAADAGFDPGRKFFSGGMTRMTFAAGAPFRSLEVQGTGSTTSRKLAANLNGAYDSTSEWLSHAVWRLDYLNSVMPAGVQKEVGQSRLAGQFLGMTRPFSGVVVRFGGMMEGGSLQSTFGAADLGSGVLSNTHYTSAKLLGGVTGNWRNQAFAASFGLGMGSTGNAFHGGWRKLIGDASHQLWLPFGNYRLFEAEQRFTAGGIQNLGSLPVEERFFGGSHEESFIPGSDWSIRSNPVIRSIPANRLSAGAAGAGGDQFFSYNSTIAVTAWGRPVVPVELRDDPQFQKLLKGAVTSQSSILQVYYKTKDPHFGAIRDKLPDVLAKLSQVRAAKDAAQSVAPATLKDDFDACSDTLDSSTNAVQHAKDDKPVPALGWVRELLPDGLGPLADSVSACGTDLLPKLAAASVPAPSLASATQDLDGMAKSIAQNFNDINEPLATQKAADDLRYVSRTLDVITKQMTITSVSPVFVFDVARIGPRPVSPFDGNRYGVGGGIRVTLVSTVSFTAGYAVNVRSRPGEGTGAFFFSLTSRNLFQ